MNTFIRPKTINTIDGRQTVYTEQHVIESPIIKTLKKTLGYTT